SCACHRGGHGRSRSSPGDRLPGARRAVPPAAPPADGRAQGPRPGHRERSRAIDRPGGGEHQPSPQGARRRGPDRGSTRVRQGPPRAVVAVGLAEPALGNRRLRRRSGPAGGGQRGGFAQPRPARQPGPRLVCDQRRTFRLERRGLLDRQVAAPHPGRTRRGGARDSRGARSMGLSGSARRRRDPRTGVPVRLRRAGPTVTAAGLALFWHRDFRRLWVGQTTSTLGSSVTSVALPIVAVATLDASTFRVALLSAAAWVPVGLPAGAWVDRLPRRPVMLACDLTALLLFLSVPVAAWLGVLTFGHLLAVALGAGTASVFFQTAYQVYLPSLLNREDVGEGNAKLQATEAAAQVGGPGLAGLITQLAGAANAVLADAASFLVSALCLLAIRTPQPRLTRAGRGSTLREEITEGLRFVIRDPYLRVLAIFSAVSNIGLIGFQSILVVFLVREVGVGPGVVGGVAAGASLGGMIGAAFATTVARR